MVGAYLLSLKHPPTQWRIEVYIDAYPPDKRKRDIDNILKPILDCLTDAAIWDDDSQVDVLRIRRMEIAKPGYVRVYISEIGQDL